jgi:hypothetical protein
MSINNGVSKRLAGLLLWLLAVSVPEARLKSQSLSPVNAAKQSSAPDAFLERRPFLQIPGPNPIVVRGGKGAWDEDVIEACDVLKDFETYYFYYHGVPKDQTKWGVLGYRIGLATASHPLGPWVKYGDQPVLDLGPKGSWEDKHVASAFVLKEKPGKFVMWYSGAGQSTPWSIGIATASKPEGPWRKYERNPIIPNFGYVGGVVKLNGTYYLYTEHPIGSTAPDYGPISLATANSPEGPWTIWDHNPVLAAGSSGAWDDGGYSESKVTYWDGLFHIFYGGAKEYQPRILTRESIGYASSADGFHFTRFGGNPVAAREAEPNMASYSEVHTLFEPPFVYAFHTIRYVDPKMAPVPGGTGIEDLGVQILAPDSAFSIAMPAVGGRTLAAGATTVLRQSPPISVSLVAHVSLTAECKYAAAATGAMRVHVRSSADGLNYDSSDLLVFANDLVPGGVARKTVYLEPGVRFIKVIVENTDKSAGLADYEVMATLSR